MSESLSQQLMIPESALNAMGEHALACYPFEMCGLLIGHPGSHAVERFVPCTNIANSAVVYTIDPKEYLRAELDAEKEGLEVIGCAHSHTHTEAYPSPTDVAQAPDPSWHYVIVSLKSQKPAPRTFRIEGDTITEYSIVSS